MSLNLTLKEIYMIFRSVWTIKKSTQACGFFYYYEDQLYLENIIRFLTHIKLSTRKRNQNKIYVNP